MALLKKRTGLNFFWSIDNSVEFLHKLSHIKYADSFGTFDFSTLYTGLPLDNVYESLEKLIIKMFKNSGSNILLINADREKVFWSRNISKYSGYKEYTVDKLLDALKFILYNTYVQFAGYIFKQVKGIPMGGNASPFIADLYLAWHEYCYMYKLSKSKLELDTRLAKILSNNSRYIDDISVINYLGFGSIAKDIYHPTLILEESNTGYHYDTFLDLLVRIHNKRFIIGIYHKVDDFNFEVINYPFPTSNIHSQVGYNTFYSQLVRYFRLCNNVKDFLARVNLIRQKLSARGYNEKTLHKYFLKFCNNYPVNIKYGVPDGAGTLWMMQFENRSKVSCSIQNIETIKKITQPCAVILKDIYQKEKIPFKNKLKKCHVDLNKVVSANSTTFETKLEVLPDVLFVYRPEGIQNPSNHCYLNSVLQLLCRVLVTVKTDIYIRENNEGKLVKLLMDIINKNSDRTLAHFKIELRQYNNFFDGSIQRDALECFNLLLDLIHKGTQKNLIDMDGSMLECDDFVTSLSKELFAFTLMKTMTCENCSKKTDTFIPGYNLDIYPDTDDYITNLLEQCMSSIIIKCCTFCMSDTNHTEVLQLSQSPKFLIIVVNRFDFNLTAKKKNYEIMINQSLCLNSSSYHLMGSVHHHGRTASSGHYTSNILCNDAAYLCNDNYIRKLDQLSYNSNSAYMVLFSRRDM